MSINRVVLVGNLTRDPELKYTPAGIALATTGIAVNRITKDDQGNYEVDFFNIVAFRRTAEFAQQYLTKGSKVALEGRLQTRSWVDQQSGQKRTNFEIIVDNIQSLERRGEGPGGPGGPVSNADAGDGGYERAPALDGGGGGAARPAPQARAQSPAPAGRGAAPANDDLDETDPFADE